MENAELNFLILRRTGGHDILGHVSDTAEFNIFSTCPQANSICSILLKSDFFNFFENFSVVVIDCPLEATTGYCTCFTAILFPSQVNEPPTTLQTRLMETRRIDKS